MSLGMEGENTQILQAPIHGTLAGPSSSGAVALNQRVHGVTTHNGNVMLVGRDYIENHYHTHPESKLTVVSVLRLVRNLRSIHLDVLSKATPGTGIWLFKTEKFILWIDITGDIRILWGTGLPGAGKTVMVSLVISELEARAAAAGGRICIAYVYFRYSDGADLTIRNVLEILVKQMVERHPECEALAQKAYARHLHESTQPTEAELFQLLHLFTGTFSATFYFLDALDEAPDKLQFELVKKLASLNVRLFITSRPLKGIESRIPGAHGFSIVAQTQDLELHINHGIENSADLQCVLEKGGPSLKEEIVLSIKKNCNGMFLHASLQLDALSQCLSPGQVRRTLEAFPSNIEDVYLQTWDRIQTRNPARVALARTVLVWVLNAARSMTLEELERAVATSPKTHKFEPDEVVPGMTLVSLCRGLITFEEESKVVRLVHYTAKGTLQGLLRDSFPTHNPILLLSNTEISSAEDFTAALQADPLLAYASDSWATHARESLDVEESKARTANFITESTEFPTFTTPGRPWSFDILGPLHILATYNLPLSLLTPDEIDDPNISTTLKEESPLILAARNGHRDFVESILAHPDTQVNLVDDEGWSALECAAFEGHEAIAKPLLAHPEIQVNMVDDNGGSALLWAVDNGYEGMVELLLAHPDIQVNLVDHGGWSALKKAVDNSHEGIARLLLKLPYTQVNLVDDNGGSALLWAVDNGYESMAKLLLAHPEIQVNLVDNDGRSALQSAFENNEEDIAKFLLAHPDIQVNPFDDDSWSPLRWAVENDHEGFATALLAHQAIQVNVVDEGGQSVLVWAACSGFKSMVRLLLAHAEIQVNSVDNDGWSALKWATSKGYEDIVQLLLDHPEIQVNARDSDGWSAFLYATMQGHENIVRLFLAHSETQVNLADNDGCSALVIAALHGNEAIVTLLLAHPEIQVNLVDTDGWSTLMKAAVRGHERVVKLFLACADIQVNLIDDQGWSALMLAAKSGHEPVIRLLLGEPHINTETKSTEDGHTAASLALAQGHTGIVELLEEFESRRAGSDLRDLDLVAVMGQDASASGEHGVRESGNPLVEESGGPVVESGEPVSEKSREPVVKEEEQPVVEDSGEAAVEASRAPTMEGSGEPVAEDAGQPIVRESGQPVLEDSGGPVVQDSRELAVEQSREPVAKESGNPLVKEVGNVESDGTNTRGTGRATPLPRWRSFLKTVFRCC